jgi:hypothetical protein
VEALEAAEAASLVEPTVPAEVGIIGMHTTYLVLFDTYNRVAEPYLMAMHRIQCR